MSDEDLHTAELNTVIVEADGPILNITLNRPQQRNAMTLSMYDRLQEIFAAMKIGGEIRAVVVTGSGGKAFASGTDIGEFRSFDGASDAIAYERRIEKALSAIEACPVPTIAAIAGACAGGGLGIAACCDIRIASLNSKFGMPMARTLGNSLSITNHARLSGLIGAARVKELVLTARLLGAHEALATGLISEVVQDDAQTVMGRAVELAHQIAAHAPLTMWSTKRALLSLRPKIDQHLDEELTVTAYASNDFAEGVSAFLEKRVPSWVGS